MKTNDEIKELAEQVYREFPSEKKDVIGHFNRDINCHRKRKAFVKGYTQCQEDMAEKKYTEDDMLQCWNACLDFNKPAGLDSGINYKDYINSLNKQD